MAMSPEYTRAQVDNCAFAVWYPKLHHVSIKSEIIPLPPAFIALLLADGVKLKKPTKKFEELIDSPPATEPPSHAQQAIDVEADVRDQVQRALKKLKGRAIPKLNWSCPRDASWMLPGSSLQCTSYEDVFLLLKASDFIVHDLTEPYALCSDVEQRSKTPETVNLVLRKWCNFYDSMHFRCFVVGHTLVGVSQRHCDEFYTFLMDQQDHLCEVIYRFFHTNLCTGSGYIHPDGDYIMDVYIDKTFKVFLLDLNVFGGVTDPLLFTWEELLEMRETVATRRQGQEEEEEVEQAVDFRIVESAKGIRPHPLSSYRTPTDFVDHLAGEGGFDAFINQVNRDQQADSDSDSDSEQEEEEEEDENVKWGSDNDDYD